jgi:hypothetical protein
MLMQGRWRLTVRGPTRRPAWFFDYTTPVPALILFSDRIEDRGDKGNDEKRLAYKGEGNMEHRPVGMEGGTVGFTVSGAMGEEARAMRTAATTAPPKNRKGRLFGGSPVSDAPLAPGYRPFPLQEEYITDIPSC